MVDEMETFLEQVLNHRIQLRLGGAGANVGDDVIANRIAQVCSMAQAGATSWSACIP